MRIFAIGIILVYHFMPDLVPGGFFGVNMFFVISGFLMTYHVLKEIDATGGISLKKFYEKRFLRIFPGVSLLIILGLVLVNFVSGDYRVDIDRQVTATFSFFTNWYEIATGGSYESQFIHHIFVHTWFLAVEIHFYIIWSLILVALIKINKKKQFMEFSQLVLLVALCLAILSYFLLFVGNFHFAKNISWLYFSDFTRLSSLFIGAVLACYLRNERKPFKHSKVITILGYGAILLMALLLGYELKVTYILGFFIVDFIAAVLILNYTKLNGKSEAKLLKTLSEASYGAYLFHWPLLVMIPTIISGILGYIIAVVLTILLVIFNSKIWEPIITGRFTSAPKIVHMDMVPKGALSVAPLVSVGIIVILTAISSFRAPSMISLKQSIWENAVKQDIEKIQSDFGQLGSQIGINVETGGVIDNGDGINIDKIVEDGGVTVIGDSVLVGPRDYIMTHMPNTFVDAEGFRLAEHGERVIEQLKENGKLGEYVVIALGNNAVADRETALVNMIKAVPKKTRLIFVTPYDELIPDHDGGIAMKKLAKKYNFITIMDWEAFGNKHEEIYEGTDGVHFAGREKAYSLYVTELKKAIVAASKGKAK